MGWGGPVVNNFEQVSSDGHQMSLAGTGVPVMRESMSGGDSLYSEVPCPEVGLEGGGAVGGGLLSEVQCIMGNVHMGLPSQPCGEND